MNFANALWCFLISISLFTGQLSVLATAAIKRSLSSFSISHSSNMCSAVYVCMYWLHKGQVSLLKLEV